MLKQRTCFSIRRKINSNWSWFKQKYHIDIFFYGLRRNGQCGGRFE